MAGTAACVARNIDLRSTPMTRSHSSSDVSSKSLRDSIPTLLWRMSRPPHCSTAVLTIAAHSAARVTSAAWASASPPSARISPALSSARSFTWSTQRTRAPSRAKRIAAALPFPRPGPREPAPVTIAILPPSRPLMERSPHRAWTWVAVPGETCAVGAEAGPNEGLEHRAAAHGASIPGHDLEPAHRPQGERTLHHRLERGDHPGKVDIFPAGEGGEVPAGAFCEEARTALPKNEPVLGQARCWNARAVASREGEDATPEVGGIDHVDQHVRLRAPRRSVEVAERLGQRVLLARESLDEVAAYHLAAVLHAEQGVAERGPVAPGELARDDAVAREQELSARFVPLLGCKPLFVAERAPAADHGQACEHAAGLTSTPAAGTRGLARPARRRHAGGDRAEGVGRDQPGPEELPERREHVRRTEAGRPGEVLGKRGAAELEVQQDVLDARGDLGRRRRSLAEPADVLAESGTHSRRATRLARGAVEHRPDHLARQPQTIEPLPLVVLHAGGQEVLLPDAHGKVFALKQLERREDPGRPNQPSIRMEMVATKEARRELLGRGHGPWDSARVDLAALEFVEHRDVHELWSGSVGEEGAPAHESPCRQALERAGRTVERDAVTLREPGRGHGPTRSQEPQRDPLEPLTRVKRPVERGVGRRHPRAPPAREVEGVDAPLLGEGTDQRSGVGGDARRDLRVGQG